MDGRFSEAKAREIKERRELEADLEAVKEMDKNWGVSGGRASRSRAAKSLKELSDDDHDDNDEAAEEKDDEGSDASAKEQMRGRGSAKYRADFAFLADDDGESDSD